MLVQYGPLGAGIEVHLNEELSAVVADVVIIDSELQRAAAVDDPTAAGADEERRTVADPGDKAVAWGGSAGGRGEGKVPVGHVVTEQVSPFGTDIAQHVLLQSSRMTGYDAARCGERHGLASGHVDSG